jgi:hypothetical protein
MNTTKKMMVMVLMAAVCTGMASTQQTTIKKRKITVMVEQDKNCPQGISVSGISVSSPSVGSGQLCVDYPEGVSYQFQKLVGSTVEVEALWTFESGLKRETPVALGQVLRIGSEKVDSKVEDACATKTHFSDATPGAANGKAKDAASIVTAASTGCQPSTATASAAIFEIRK